MHKYGLHSIAASIIFYSVLIVSLISLTELVAVAKAIAFAYAAWSDTQVCQGTYIQGATRINYSPVTYYGTARYRIELSSTLIYEPRTTNSNVPNWDAIKWDTGGSLLFDGITVWYWDSGIFYTTWETYWLDFETGSAYPQTLTMRVKDVSGWHLPSEVGEASVDILYCGGPLSVNLGQQID